MAELLNDPELLSLTNFYKCYRAYVRGKVAAIKSVEPEVPVADRERSRERATQLFRRALNYAVAGSEPLVITVMGRVASGKSTVARLAGEALGWPVFSSDRTRKELAGVAPHVRGDAATRAQLYQESMTAAPTRRSSSRAIESVREKGARFSTRPSIRRAQRDLLRERSKPREFAIVWWRSLRRMKKSSPVSDRREASRKEVSDARLEDFELLRTRYEPFHPGRSAFPDCQPVEGRGDDDRSAQGNGRSRPLLEMI